MAKERPPHWGGWQADRNAVLGGPNDLMARHRVPARAYLIVGALVVVGWCLLLYLIR